MYNMNECDKAKFGWFISLGLMPQSRRFFNCFGSKSEMMKKFLYLFQEYQAFCLQIKRYFNSDWIWNVQGAVIYILKYSFKALLNIFNVS